MKSKLAGIHITSQPTAAGVNGSPEVILNPLIENALSKIHTSRRETVRKFCGFRIAQKIKKATVMNYCKAITALETIEKDYKSITRDDFVAWVSVLDTHYSPATAQLYQVLVKTFMRWVYYGDSEDAEYPEPVRWIKAHKLEQNYTKPVLSKEQAYKLIRAADHPRDRALLFCLCESGCRAGELLGLRIKDVTIAQNVCMIRVNGKTGFRETPLVECVSDMQQWLNIHPFRDNPEYALWKTDRNPKKGMGYNTLYWLVRKVARLAGLPEEISPHSLRHASVTDKANVLNESQLRAYFGWKSDSKMPARYTHPEKKTIVEILQKKGGVLPIEKAVQHNPTAPKACPRCNSMNSALSLFCTQCGMALDIKTAMEVQDRSVKADNFTADILAELMKQAPDLLAKIIAEKGGVDRVKDIAGGEVAFESCEAIKLIL